MRVASLDQLVGAFYNQGRDGNPELHGCFEVDDQLNRRGLYDWQVGGHDPLRMRPV
jgi:hypothetical protein